LGRTNTTYNEQYVLLFISFHSEAVVDSERNVFNVICKPCK
jgi:hypothetical protein